MKTKSFLGIRFAQLKNRFVPSETLVMTGVALVVGLISGLGVWLFKQLINLVDIGAFTKLDIFLQPLGKWSIALIPAFGGLVVGLIVHFFAKEESHGGVAGVMESVALAGGRLRYQRAPAKVVVAAISIGSGASLGPEDPSVQIGANVGSMFGQLLHLSDERVRTLVASGAAAGIAAAFNAPIAGVFFALEIVLGEISIANLGAIVMAAVISSAVTQAISGAQPAFSIPAYAFKSAWELPLYLVLGLLAGPVAAIYARLIYAFQDGFHALKVPGWVKPIIAGLALGAVGIFLPQIFGTGYGTIGQILSGQNMAFGLLVALLIAKLVMTPTSLGGGFVGGVFAPSLFLGAALGGAYGVLMSHLFPGLAISPSAFAMVGMAATLAGAVHAPLTAIILLFEMTGDYRIILPLMFAVAVSLLVSQFMERDSVYMFGLARSGIRLDRRREVEVLESIRVEEVMQTDIVTLEESTSLVKASDIMTHTHHHGLPVLNGANELVGILTLQDIENVQKSGKESVTVGDIYTRKLQVTYPDETIGTALQRMSKGDLGRLPVVARDAPRHLLGMLHRSDIVHAYNIALTRRAADRHQAHQVRLEAVTPENVNVVEVEVQTSCECVDMLVKDIAWPKNSVIASLRRGRQVMIPRGDTKLNAGDILVVVAGEKEQNEVKKLCSCQDSS